MVSHWGFRGLVLFGKMPVEGDFISRNLSGPEEAAIYEELLALRDIGQTGLDFDWGPFSGIIMPSADRVGRSFPLLLARRNGPVSEAWRAHAVEAVLCAQSEHWKIEELLRKISSD